MGRRSRGFFPVVDGDRLADVDTFAHRPKEKCTAAALRAESPDVDVVTRVGRLASERDIESWRALTGGRPQAR